MMDDIREEYQKSLDAIYDRHQKDVDAIWRRARNQYIVVAVSLWLLLALLVFMVVR